MKNLQSTNDMLTENPLNSQFSIGSFFIWRKWMQLRFFGGYLPVGMNIVDTQITRFS